jgi:hypothetical protein
MLPVNDFLTIFEVKTIHMVLKKDLRKTLNSYLKGSISIKEKDMAREVMEKKLFIENIILLREIEDRRDFMEEELGLDMSIYEEKFLQIIENLFKIHFSKEQFALYSITSTKYLP